MRNIPVYHSLKNILQDSAFFEIFFTDIF